MNCPPERFTTEWITADAGAAGPMTGGAPPVPAGARRSSASARWVNLSTRAREMGDASGCDRSPGPLRNDAGNDAPRHRAPLAYRREGQRGNDHERPRPMRLLHVRQGRSEGRPLCLPAQIGVGPGQPPEPYGHWLAPKPAPSRMRAVAGSGETRLTRNKLYGVASIFRTVYLSGREKRYSSTLSPMLRAPVGSPAGRGISFDLRISPDFLLNPRGTGCS